MAIDDEPYAEITRIGWHLYSIVIHDGLITFGPAMDGVVLGWSRFGLDRARAKADRELARYKTRGHAQTWRVS